MKKKIFNYGLVFLLIGLTAYFIFRNHDLTILRSNLAHANLNYILLSLGCMILYKCTDGRMIQITLKSIYGRVSFRKAMKYAMIGFYYSAVTPFASGGQPAQVYHMSKDQITLAASSATLIIKFVFYQTMVTLYSLVLYFVAQDFVRAQIKGMMFLIELGLFLNILAITFVFLTIFNEKLVRKIANGILNLIHRFKKLKYMEKYRESIGEHIDEYKESLDKISGNKALILRLFILTFVQLNCYFIVPYLVYLAFGLSGKSFIYFIAVQALLTMAVSFIPSPGALGVSEGGFVALFRLFFPPGILISAMVLWRGITYYAVLLIGGMVALISHIRSINKKAFLKPKNYLFRKEKEEDGFDK